jgi:hypothetical protein
MLSYRSCEGREEGLRRGQQRGGSTHRNASHITDRLHERTTIDLKRRGEGINRQQQGEQEE